MCLALSGALQQSPIFLRDSRSMELLLCVVYLVLILSTRASSIHFLCQCTKPIDLYPEL